jgi:histidinol phosphatase-like enzyme (inositol monophosphatase family)
MTSHADFIACAHELADLSGQTILPYFRKPLWVTNKAQRGFDPVTVADTAAETVIRDALARRFPAHGIVGEEFGTRDSASRYRWIIDPIDGTRAFMIGVPLWGTLIGLMEHDTPIVGMMDQPFTAERFWATSRGAYYRRGPSKPARLTTRASGTLDAAVLVATSPDMFKTRTEKAAFARVSNRVRLTRFGGDCYAYCLLAAGHIDLVVEAGLKAVDIAPLIPIIEQAGGAVSDWRGGTAVAGGNVVAAANRKIHAAALDLLAG